MTIKSDFGEVHLDVDPGARRSATMLEPETPFRILLLGEFSGRSSTSWKPVEVDRDNFEEVLARASLGFSGRDRRAEPAVPRVARGAAETGDAFDFCRSGRRDPRLERGARPACRDGADGGASRTRGTSSAGPRAGDHP